MYRRLGATGTNGLELLTSWHQIAAGLWLDPAGLRKTMTAVGLASTPWPLGITLTIPKLRQLSLVMTLMSTLQPREEALVRARHPVRVSVGLNVGRRTHTKPWSSCWPALRDDPTDQVWWPTPFLNVCVIGISASGVVLTRASQIQTYLADCNEELIVSKPPAPVLLLAECGPDTVRVAISCRKGSGSA